MTLFIEETQLDVYPIFPGVLILNIFFYNIYKAQYQTHEPNIVEHAKQLKMTRYVSGKQFYHFLPCFNFQWGSTPEGRKYLPSGKAHPSRVSSTVEERQTGSFISPGKQKRSLGFFFSFVEWLKNIDVL